MDKGKGGKGEVAPDPHGAITGKGGRILVSAKAVADCSLWAAITQVTIH